jgi:hypothetical protein
MSQNNPPYVEFMAGQLIAAEVMNDMQSQIRADIGTQTQTAVDNIEVVPRSEDANMLDGQTLAEITQAIVDQALSQIARRSGYMRVFRKLQLENEVVIEHGLQNCPLVDLYQLDYFRVVAAEDDYKYLTWVNFYLYHSSEKRIRFEPDTGTAERVEIEPADGQAYRIPFRDLLAWYNVKYNDESSLGDIETEFWDALFAAPSERFDDDQYAKSPWFDRCCRDERTVRSLKQRDDWNELWVKVMPRKTTNYPQPDPLPDEPPRQIPPPTLAPTNVSVSHFDLNRIGLRLLAPPIYSPEVVTGLTDEQRTDALQELKVMALLRA